MSNKVLFSPDDIERINNKYFKRIREQGLISSDPSYWYNNTTEAALEFGMESVKNYKSDYQYGLYQEKPYIINAYSFWDKTNYQYDDITVCSSATTASLIILAYIKHSLGIKKIAFETPCYFGSLQQAMFLGLETEKLPTYFEDDFRVDWDLLKENKEPKVIWLTQPRYGLGTNQPALEIEKCLSCMTSKDLLVIDEATEQKTPSSLHKYNFQYDNRIIKIRSPFKPIGINGPRISTIIHGTAHRKTIQNVLEQVQGAIDIFSLEFLIKTLNDESRLTNMLSLANKQVTDLRKKVCLWSIGTLITPSNLENGYIGSVSIEYSNTDMPYIKRRELLLRHCSDHKMPVILGANLYFAKDPKREHVRISYFNSYEDIKKAINILSLFRLT